MAYSSGTMCVGICILTVGLHIQRNSLQLPWRSSLCHMPLNLPPVSLFTTFLPLRKQGPFTARRDHKQPIFMFLISINSILLF